MFKQKLLLIIFAVFILLSFSFSQTQTGSIIGNVKDTSGEFLPGVNISIKSPSLIQPVLTTSSNQRGYYRFVNLPPGFYTLTAELKGFKTVERKEVRVLLGETATVDMVMEQGALEEVVNVTAALPTVDVKKSEVSVVFTKEMLKSLPFRTHDIGIVDITPGIYDRVANGSSLASNQYQVDGQNVTDQWWGNNQPNINFDVIEESEVTSAGGQAEFGEYTGAVVNAITKSGGNSLKGEASFYFFNNKLVSYRKDEISPPAIHYDTSLLVGGPIKKDRLWFFIAGAYRRDEKKSLDIPNPTPTTNSRPYVYGKFNYLVDNNNKGFFSYQFDKWVYRQGMDEFRSPISLYTRNYKEHIVNFQHQMILDPNTILEAKFSYKRYAGDVTVDRDDLPYVYDLATHYERAAGNQPNGDKTWRTRLMFDLTHFKDNWLLGSHEFKLGFTFDRAKGTNYFSFPADTILLEMNGQPLIKMVQDHRDIVPEGMQEYNAYAQDGWTIKDRLTLNLGLRWSYSSARVLDVVTPDGTTKKGRGQMYAWNNISPRLGISYALTRDNKTVLKMSWGRFFDADNWMIFYGFGPYSQTVTTYFWDPSSKSWIFSDISGPATNTNIDPNLKRYYADVLTAGIQREIFANFSIELNYVHKYFGNQLAYINTQGQYVSQTAIDPVTGQSIIVYDQTNVGDNYYLETNPKDFNYKYDGADLIATKRFSGNWFAQASFHWQKCEGLGTNDYEARSGYHDILKDPNNKINAIGPAPYDRTYLLRFLVSCLLGRWESMLRSSLIMLRAHATAGNLKCC